MLSFHSLSERLRFLIYSLGIILFPFFIILIFNSLTIFKQNFISWSEEILLKQESYLQWKINGPETKEGIIRFPKEKMTISLNEVIKKIGGTGYGYRVFRGDNGNEIFFEHHSLVQVDGIINLDLTGYLEKIPFKNNSSKKFQKKTQFSKKQTYDRIRKHSVNNPGEKNERKSRYR